MAKRPTQTAKAPATQAPVEQGKPAEKDKPAEAARELTAAEVAALATSWDAARTELRAASDQILDIGSRTASLAPDADRTALDAELTAAIGRKAAAQAALDALTLLPEGTKLPNAAPAESRAPTQEPHTTTTPLSEDGEDGTGSLAGPADDRFSLMRASAMDTFELFRARAADLAARGDVADSVALLRDQRSELVEFQAIVRELLPKLDQEIAALERLAATAPIEATISVTATVDSRFRAGRKFTRETTIFSPGELTADELGALQEDTLLVVEVQDGRDD
jgi:hypothetical protein